MKMKAVWQGMQTHFDEMAIEAEVQLGKNNLIKGFLCRNSKKKLLILVIPICVHNNTFEYNSAKYTG